MSRSSLLRVRAACLVLLGAALVVVTGLLTACGTAGSGDGIGSGSGPSTPAGVDTPVLSIEQVLEAEEGSYVWVRGHLLVTGEGPEVKMVLATGLAESYPPQAGRPTLELSGLDPDSLVGLNTTVDQEGVQFVPATWSDAWLTLGGIVHDGILAVQTTPRVVSVAAPEVAAVVRFSPVSEPVASGEAVWWAFDLRNTGETPLTLLTGSQRVDVALSQDGVEKYRWSADKAFTEELREITIAPGEVWPVTVNDIINVSPGEYDLEATLEGELGKGIDAGREGPLGENWGAVAFSTTITIE